MSRGDGRLDTCCSLGVPCSSRCSDGIVPVLAWWSMLMRTACRGVGDVQAGVPCACCRWLSRCLLPMPRKGLTERGGTVRWTTAGAVCSVSSTRSLCRSCHHLLTASQPLLRVTLSRRATRKASPRNTPNVTRLAVSCRQVQCVEESDCCATSLPHTTSKVHQELTVGAEQQTNSACKHLCVQRPHKSFSMANKARAPHMKCSSHSSWPLWGSKCSRMHSDRHIDLWLPVLPHMNRC